MLLFYLMLLFKFNTSIFFFVKYPTPFVNNFAKITIFLGTISAENVFHNNECSGGHAERSQEQNNSTG